MPSFGNLPIMPRESRTPMATHGPSTAPYPAPVSAATRSAGIWNATDDETLLQARASGLNWGPIARKHFPNKTPNACRKRHERLVERRQVEDWDMEKLEFLAQEYMTARKEMWEVLGNRLGERWSVVEAKCMEKGLKNLQAAARSSQRRAAAGVQTGSFDEHGVAGDRNSDSGIGMCSDGEMDVAHGAGNGSGRTSYSWHAHGNSQQPLYAEHSRSHSLPQPLPLYQPPPPVMHTGQRAFPRYSPESQNGRGGISIQSMLSPADPQRT